MQELDEGIKVRDVGRPLLPNIRPLPFNYWRLVEDIWLREYGIRRVWENSVLQDTQKEETKLKKKLKKWFGLVTDYMWKEEVKF